MKFQEQDIPVNSLKELGLHDGKTNLLPLEIKEQLLRGHLTDFIQLKNISLNKDEKINIDAKLSLRQKADGATSLLIHPIYSKKQDHALLSSEENQLFQKDGIHTKRAAAHGILTDHGSARYQFEEKGQPSYFVRLAKPNGDTFEIWGKDLQRALQESKHEIGDNIQLNFVEAKSVSVEVPKYNKSGEKEGTEWVNTVRNTWEVSDYKEELKKEKTLLFEYDEDTKSFVGVDADDILVPEAVNGMHLTPQQKREFKDGKVVTLPDDTQIQVSPASKNNMSSNRKWLIASVLLDGGISFVMYHILKALHDKVVQNNKALEKEYNRGYLDALNKVKADLEKKQSQYPDNKEIARDLDILGKEISTVNVQQVNAVDINDKNVNDIKAKVNDPELDDNALREQKEANAIKESIENPIRVEEVKHEVETVIDNPEAKVIVQKESISESETKSVNIPTENSPVQNIQSESEMKHIAFAKSKTDGTLFIDRQSSNDRHATFEIVQDIKGAYFYTLNEANRNAMVSALVASDSYLNDKVATTVNSLTHVEKPYTGLTYIETKYKPIDKIDESQFKVVETLELKGVYNTNYSIQSKVDLEIERQQRIDELEQKSQSAGFKR